MGQIWRRQVPQQHRARLVGERGLYRTATAEHRDLRRGVDPRRIPLTRSIRAATDGCVQNVRWGGANLRFHTASFGSGKSREPTARQQLRLQGEAGQVEQREATGQRAQLPYLHPGGHSSKSVVKMQPHLSFLSQSRRGVDGPCLTRTMSSAVHDGKCPVSTDTLRQDNCITLFTCSSSH